MSHRGPRAADSAARRAEPDVERREVAAGAACWRREERLDSAGAGRDSGAAEPLENDEANRSRSSTISVWLDGVDSMAAAAIAAAKSAEAAEAGALGTAGRQARRQRRPASRSRQRRPGSRLRQRRPVSRWRQRRPRSRSPNAVVVAAAAVEFAATATACADCGQRRCGRLGRLRLGRPSRALAETFFGFFGARSARAERPARPRPASGSSSSTVRSANSASNPPFAISGAASSARDTGKAESRSRRVAVDSALGGAVGVAGSAVDVAGRAVGVAGSCGVSRTLLRVKPVSRVAAG